MPIAIALTSWMLLASPGAKDLDEVCRLAKAVVAEKPSSFAAGRGDWWDHRWVKWRTQMDEHPHDHDFQSALTASGDVSPAGKYGVFTAYAKEIGQPGWVCPDLQKVLVSSDRDLDLLCDEAKGGAEALAGAAPALNSEPVKAAWAAAQKKKGADGFAMLVKVAEWPEQTFKNCDELKAALGVPVAEARPNGRPQQAAAAPRFEVAVPFSADGLSTYEAEQVMQKANPTLSECIGLFRASPGKLKMSLELNKKGTVVGYSCSSGTLWPQTFFDCVSTRVRALTFPAPDSAKGKVWGVLEVK